MRDRPAVIGRARRRAYDWRSAIAWVPEPAQTLRYGSQDLGFSERRSQPFEVACSCACSSEPLIKDRERLTRRRSIAPEGASTTIARTATAARRRPCPVLTLFRHSLRSPPPRICHHLVVRREAHHDHALRLPPMREMAPTCVRSTIPLALITSTSSQGLDHSHRNQLATRSGP